MYTYAHLCVCVHVYIFICRCPSMCTHVLYVYHICVFYIHVYVCMCTCTCTCVCMFMCVHVYVLFQRDLSGAKCLPPESQESLYSLSELDSCCLVKHQIQASWNQRACGSLPTCLCSAVGTFDINGHFLNTMILVTWHLAIGRGLCCNIS